MKYYLATKPMNCEVAYFILNHIWSYLTKQCYIKEIYFYHFDTKLIAYVIYFFLINHIMIFIILTIFGAMFVFKMIQMRCLSEEVTPLCM